MIKIKKISLTLVMIFTALLGGIITTTGSVSAKSSDKTLVVYFSRTKGVYGNKSLKQGNTAQVAKFIQQKTNADIYEIKPQKSYPNSYNATSKIAQKEQDQNARPAIKGTLPNVKKYNTVFIGGPIWWGEYPMVVRTFLDQEKGLDGKTLIPFTTSEGSGLGNTSSVLRKQFKNSTVRNGFSIKGSTVENNSNTAQKKVNRWLNDLGY